jgi:hypothetical protein
MFLDCFLINSALSSSFSWAAFKDLPSSRSTAVSVLLKLTSVCNRRSLRPGRHLHSLYHYATSADSSYTCFTDYINTTSVSLS